MPNAQHIWRYRGHELKPLEWGLWKAVGEPGRYFLCFRPEGRGGPCVRQWARTGGGITVGDLRQKVRSVRAEIEGRKLGIVDPEPIATEAAVDQYVASLREQERDRTYVSILESAIRRYLKWTASDAAAGSGIAPAETLADITIPCVDAFLQHLQALGRTGRTRNKYRGYLIAWLNWAIARGQLESNSLERMGRATELRGLVQFPLPEKMVALTKRLRPYDAALMGESMEDIAAWLGHASPETTRKHYAHLRTNGYANIESNRVRVLTMRSQLMAVSLGETKKADA